MRVNASAVTRRRVVVGAITLASGCLGSSSGGEQATDADAGDDGSSPQTDTVTTGAPGESGGLTLTSPAFEDGGRIPEQYGYEAANLNPPLVIRHVPAKAESLALIMEDPDAVEPAGKVWDHWIVWNIPPGTTTIPQGWTPSEATQGTNDFGNVGYDGPNPPDSVHTYRFVLFAVDTRLELPRTTDADALRSAIESAVLDRAVLHGTYPP